ncbi:hypothetical protein [Aeromonas phage Aer_P220]|uniref:Uncharacterized protein n=1 Tax=Aeromonas phage Aer_P220 TaxID=2951227 RepID=A0A9E7NNH3_9CAUD|nr:hypothetical protein [Aeromonas phage Aer_P220]
MTDMTRKQVIDWCKKVGADFKEVKYRAPDGWMWARDGDGLILTAIFTNTEDADIYLSDVVKYNN